MPPLNPAIAMEVREIMSGFARDVTGAAGEIDSKKDFAFDLLLRAPQLQAFIDGPQHVVQVASGFVTWQGHGGRLSVRPGGTVTMFRRDPADPGHKYFDFRFSFADVNGVVFDFLGGKDLHDDHGFDAAADMSSVRFDLRTGGQVVAAGTTKVHPDEILEQLLSLRIRGAANSAEESLARRSFLDFMNRQISEVYPEMPHLFRIDKTLSVGEWRVLGDLVAAMRPENAPPEGPTSEDVVAQLEKFIVNADSAQITNIRGVLGIVAALAPLIDGHWKEFRRLAEDVLLRNEDMHLKPTIESIHQLTTLPYFAHPKADAIVGYHRPAIAPGLQPDLRVAGPAEASEIESRVWDVAIVGSGVAGSLLADRLTAAGRSVLLLEAGPYIPEKTITTDELLWLARLYKEGGLQLANPTSGAGAPSPRFPILQASCVGGGGVINNAVCFRLPPDRLQRWHDRDFPVTQAELNAGYDKVAEELQIRTIRESSHAMNPAAQYLGGLGPIQPANMQAQQVPGLYECAVNLEARNPADPDDRTRGCVGLGLCNTGCGSERKLNALRVYLPRALSRDCQLLPDAEVREVLLSHFQMGNPQRVKALRVRHLGRTLNIQAREYVLSAGAIASSALLLKSPDLRRNMQKKVGMRLSANIGSPVHAFFDQPIHSGTSTQIAHYVIPPAGGPGYILESWFNPPGAQSVAVPGYFEQHFERLQQYASMITLAPLVGTESTGVLHPSGRVDMPLGDAETARMKAGLSYLIRALLKGGTGVRPRMVLVGLDGGREIRTEADLARLENDLTNLGGLRVGTGHPQGGNAMGKDETGTVVDRDYRVLGMTNLRICDASVFPDNAGVNPQWTVMALAHDCAVRMLNP